MWIAADRAAAFPEERKKRDRVFEKKRKIRFLSKCIRTATSESISRRMGINASTANPNVLLISATFKKASQKRYSEGWKAFKVQHVYSDTRPVLVYAQKLFYPL